MIEVTSSQLKNGIGKYLDLVLLEREIVITRHNRAIAKLVVVETENQENKDIDNS